MRNAQKRSAARWLAAALLCMLALGNARAASPRAPESIRVARNAIDAQKVRIAWDAVPSAQRYAVYRLDSDGTFAYLGRTYGTSFSCRDYGAQAVYVVRSIDAQANESDALTAATLAGQTWINAKAASLTAAVLGAATPSPAPDGTGTALERDTLASINVRRKQYDKATYAWNDAAYIVAQQRADEMREHNDFSHTAYDYGSVLDTYSALTEIRPRSSGECIYASSNPLDAESIVEAWMNSPGHRDILLDNGGFGFDQAAIATGRYASGTSYQYSGWYYAVLIVHR